MGSPFNKIIIFSTYPFHLFWLRLQNIPPTTCTPCMLPLLDFSRNKAPGANPLPIHAGYLLPATLQYTNSHPHWTSQLQRSLSGWHHAINCRLYKLNCRTRLWLLQQLPSLALGRAGTASTPACPSPVSLGAISPRALPITRGWRDAVPISRNQWPRAEERSQAPPCMQ